MKEEIESRFQLLITISLFFPVLLSNLGTLAGQTPQRASFILIQTSVVVGLYLIDYIIFHTRKKSLTHKSLTRISTLLLVAMGLFIVPILGIALSTVNLPSSLAAAAAWLSGTSVLFILAAPPLIELILLFSPSRKE